MKEISEQEWKKIKEKSDSRKPFNELFKITCKKCNSGDIETFGNYDDSGCYYSGEIGDNEVIVKCHGCGNAKVFTFNSTTDMEKIE